MADQGIESLASGLASSLNSYLGGQIQAQTDVAKQTQLNDLGEQRDAAKQDAEAKRQIATKRATTNFLSPDMAEKALPGYGGKMVNDYNAAHPDLPLTMDEGSKYLKQAQDILNPDTEKAEGHQDKLEKDYADRLQKVVAARSGGLGMADQKVDQARQLRVLLNQYYDPKTDSYSVPPAQHSELAIGMAKLLSSNGQISTQMEEQLRQKTAKEGLSNALIYAGMDPAIVGGPTNSVVKMFRDSIDRQGLEAEHQRDQYITGLKGLAPTKLNPDRIKKLNEATLTSSFKDILAQSPDKQAHFDKHPVGKIRVLDPDGKLGLIPASQLDDAIKAGYKQAK